VSLSHEAVKGSVDGGGERGESASAGGTGAEVAGGRRQRVGGGATMGAGEARGCVAAQRDVRRNDGDGRKGIGLLG
jgi:hypothetical protein